MMKQRLLRVFLIAAVVGCIGGCSRVSVKPMMDEEGKPIFIDGVPIPVLVSDSTLLDRDIEVEIIRQADGSLTFKLKRRDREKGTDMGEIIRDGIIDGLKIGAGAAGGAAVAP